MPEVVLEEALALVIVGDGIGKGAFQSGTFERVDPGAVYPVGYLLGRVIGEVGASCPGCCTNMVFGHQVIAVGAPWPGKMGLESRPAGTVDHFLERPAGPLDLPG